MTNTTNPLDFQPWPKIPRLNRIVTLTEKIDGSNAQVLVTPVECINPILASVSGNPFPFLVEYLGREYALLAGSRTRWLTLEADNYGFCRWVSENKHDLVKLGPGRHFGEWWGRGINRGYGLQERRFSLFNVGRWTPVSPDGGVTRVVEADPESGTEAYTVHGPTCVRVVPTIWRGTFDQFDVDACCEMLRVEGSFAAPGFRNPEGLVVYHEAAKQSFKVLLENDHLPKGAPVTEGV